MPNVTFRGTQIRSINAKPEESGVIFRIHCAADLSQPVVEAFGWPAFDEVETKTELRTELSGDHMTFTPNGRELKQHAMSLECKDVSGFVLSRVKDGEHTRTKLTFIARSSDAEAGARLHEYLKAIGQGDAALKVAYSEQKQLFDDKKAPDVSASNEEEKQESLELDDDGQEPIGNFQRPPLADAREMQEVAAKATRRQKAN